MAGKRYICDSHTRNNCKYAHDAKFRLRPDLLSSCPYLDNTGKCRNTWKAGCNCKHPPSTTLSTPSTQPAQERAASAVASEMDDPKAMTRTLMKEGAEHKAMMAAILSQEED